MPSAGAYMLVYNWKNNSSSSSRTDSSEVVWTDTVGLTALIDQNGTHATHGVCPGDAWVSSGGRETGVGRTRCWTGIGVVRY